MLQRNHRGRRVILLIRTRWLHSASVLQREGANEHHRDSERNEKGRRNGKSKDVEGSSTQALSRAECVLIDYSAAQV